MCECFKQSGFDRSYGNLLHSVQRLVTCASETGEEVIAHNYEAELDPPEASQKLGRLGSS